MAVDPHASCVNHQKYALLCDDYDALLVRAGGRCEICSLPAEENRFGKLFIDHDYSVGQWAVRGLLCDICNLYLGGIDTAPAQHYNANPFYLALLAEVGVALTGHAEPSVGRGFYVAAGGARGHYWCRFDEGWRRTCEDTAACKSTWCIPWERLMYRFGPHNLFAGSLLEFDGRFVVKIVGDARALSGVS